MVANSVRFTTCTFERHGAAILEIFNHAIETSTALYEYQPRTLETIEAWFATKTAGGFPVIGVVNDSDTLLGFASYGPFRPQPAYKYTVEHSVYVHPDQRGNGYGRMLLQWIIQEAEAHGMHTLVGAIDAQNLVSLQLHESLGFVKVGSLPQVGFKFGRWLDLTLVQLTLAMPSHPIDG